LKQSVASIVVCVLTFPIPLSAAADEITVHGIAPLKSCAERSVVILAIEEQPQKLNTSWCWAAATHNVTEYIFYRKQPFPLQAPTQCAMAEIMAKATPRSDTCCDFPIGQSNIACQTTRWPEQIMDELRFSYSPELVLNGDNSRPPDKYWPLEWSDVIQQICSEHPYISVIGRSMQQTHAVVVHGFYQVKQKLGSILFSGRAVQVYDPLTDQSYSDFGRYSSLFSFGGATGVTANGEQHFGDTYNINKIPILVAPPPPTPLHPVPPPHTVPLPELEHSTPTPLRP